MTARDRLMILAMGALAVLGVVWIALVAPERHQAASAQAQVSAASAQLAAAEGQAASGRDAQARYSAAYASVVSLGKAVPPSQEVPSLIYQLAQASNQKHVEFSSIVAGAGAGSTAAPSAAASASATASAATTAFTQMPFTFIFNGSFQDLYHLFQQLNRFTVHTASGVQVSGRLLTIQSAKLAPSTSEAPGAGSGRSRSPRLTGTITATAYVLPAGQSLTGGATAAAPASSASSASTPSGAASASSPTPTATAIAR